MSTPDLALTLQQGLKHWPIPQMWHDIARLRTFPIRVKNDGREFSRKDWPSSCYIPIGVLESWLQAQGYTAHPKVIETWPTDDPDPANFGGPEQQVSGFAATSAFLARWRMGKGVYRFQDALWEAITATDLDPAIPIDVLEYLPEWAVLVETPGLTFAGAPVRGVGLHIDSLFPVRHVSILSIRLILDHNRAHTRCLLLTAPTLGECLAESEDYAREHVKEFGYGRKELLPILSIALYLCARNRDIRSPEGAEFTPPVPREVVAGKKGPKAFAAGKISTWQVGWRIGAALEAAARRERNEDLPSAPTGVPRKPHIRRAHWHLYWTGKGRSEPQIKWLPPTPVNVTRVTEPTVTVHPIQSERNP